MCVSNVQCAGKIPMLLRPLLLLLLAFRMNSIYSRQSTNAVESVPSVDANFPRRILFRRVNLHGRPPSKSYRRRLVLCFPLASA